MNKFYLTILCAAALGGSVSAQNKLDLNAREAFEVYQTKLLSQPQDGMAATRSSAQAESVAALITLKSAQNVADLEAMGYEIDCLFGDMAMINLPLNEVEALAEKDFVVQISFGGEAQPLLDKARAGSNVDPIHDGTGAGLNGISYTGKGVAVGVYDTGLDPNHINFRDRVKAVYQVKGSSASLSASTSKTQIERYTTDNTGETHGTHVLGIAAGGFKGTLNYAGTVKPTTGANPYYGVAPESDIIVGCGDLYNACILKGVTNIVDKAAELDKPVVVNLSLGINTGAHDGKDSFGRALDELGKRAIILVAAGNEGDMPMGLTKKLTADDPTVKTYPAPYDTKAYGNNVATNYNGTIEIYSNDDTPFTCRIVVTNRYGEVIDEYVLDATTSGKKAYIGGSGTASNYVHLDSFDKATSSTSKLDVSSNVDTYTKRYSVVINHTLSMTQAKPSAYLGIIIEGKPGQLINMYANPTTSAKANGIYSTFIDRGVDGWDNGSCNGTINSMACGDNVFVIGSWNTRKNWYTLSGAAAGYNGSDSNENLVSSFSSYGTIYNGTNLPHVLAPGSGIISSYSNYYSGLNSDTRLLANLAESDRKNPYDYMQGTSMATPFATGVVALWLEADPNLTVKDVKDIAMSTAVKDSYTAKADPVKVGAGKLDALAGLKEVLRRADTGVDAIIDDASSKLIVEAKGDNVYSVFLGGADNLNVGVYSVAGQQMMRVTEQGDELTLDLSTLSKGIYVIDVAAGNSGHETTKILVK